MRFVSSLGRPIFDFDDNLFLFVADGEELFQCLRADRQLDADAPNLAGELVIRAINCEASTLER